MPNIVTTEACHISYEQEKHVQLVLRKQELHVDDIDMLPPGKNVASYLNPTIRKCILPTWARVVAQNIYAGG